MKNPPPRHTLTAHDFRNAGAHEMQNGRRVFCYYVEPHPTPRSMGRIVELEADGWHTVETDDGTRYQFDHTRLAVLEDEHLVDNEGIVYDPARSIPDTVDALEDELEEAKTERLEYRRRMETLELLDPNGLNKIKDAMDAWIELVRRIDRLERTLDQFRGILEHGLEDRTRYNSPANLGR